MKYERAQWRELSVKCDKANWEAFAKGATRPVDQMPLQWTEGSELLAIPYTDSSKSARLVQPAVVESVGTSSQKK